MGLAFALSKGTSGYINIKEKWDILFPEFQVWEHNHIASSECCKGLAGAPTGDKAHSSSGS